MNNKKFSWKARRNSFCFAFAGLKALFRTEHNAWLHAGLTVVAAVLAILLRVSLTEAAVLVLVTGAVWAAEIFNTALEKLADHVTPERHPQIKLVKDLAAAAVLITALTALVVAALVFVPKLLRYV